MGTEFALGFIETSGWYTLAVMASMEAHLKILSRSYLLSQVVISQYGGGDLNLLVSIVISIALILDDINSGTLTK
jgi:hypothetical protein